MWQACLVMLLSASMVIWCRGLGGWRLFAVVCAFISALGFIIAASVTEQFSESGINEAAWFHLTEIDLPLPLLLQFWPIAIGVLSLWVFAFVLLYGGWRRQRAHANTIQPDNAVVHKRYGYLMVLLLALLLQPAWQHMQQLASFQQQMRTVAQIQAEQVYDWQVTPPAAPRSFVYIYVESLSAVFLDGERYPNLMPRLNALLPQAVKVDGIAQLDTTAWTIAGIAASQCGAPGALYG